MGHMRARRPSRGALESPRGGARAALPRLGYLNYSYVHKEFEMRPPGDDPQRLKGLAGDRAR